MQIKIERSLSSLGDFASDAKCMTQESLDFCEAFGLVKGRRSFMKLKASRKT
jgi:hypothetical protein